MHSGCERWKREHLSSKPWPAAAPGRESKRLPTGRPGQERTILHFGFSIFDQRCANSETAYKVSYSWLFLLFFSSNPKLTCENPTCPQPSTLLRITLADGKSKSHHLMTLSARASTLGGIVKPICLAVLRLITSSNFVGCSTGRPAGFAPLRILST